MAAMRRAKPWFVRENAMLQAARFRANTKGIPCTLTRADVEEITASRVCAYCGCRVRGAKVGSNSQYARRPTLDALIPADGYVRSNVVLACATCNRRKDDLTPPALRALATKIEELLEKCHNG